MIQLLFQVWQRWSDQPEVKEEKKTKSFLLFKKKLYNKSKGAIIVKSPQQQ